MLLIYSRQCTSCKTSKEMKLLRVFADQHRLKFQVRRTLINQVFADEADRLTDVPQPFVWNEDTRTAIHLSGATENDLQHLL